MPSQVSRYKVCSLLLCTGNIICRGSILTGKYVHNHHIYQDHATTGCYSLSWRQNDEQRTIGVYLAKVCQYVDCMPKTKVVTLFIMIILTAPRLGRPDTRHTCTTVCSAKATRQGFLVCQIAYFGSHYCHVLGHETVLFLLFSSAKELSAWPPKLCQRQMGVRGLANISLQCCCPLDWATFSPKWIMPITSLRLSRS